MNAAYSVKSGSIRVIDDMRKDQFGHNPNEPVAGYETKLTRRVAIVSDDAPDGFPDVLFIIEVSFDDELAYTFITENKMVSDMEYERLFRVIEDEAASSLIMSWGDDLEG